ncbi:hypothetical protein ACHAXH_001065 [Discostella pseudostelligera]
MHLIKILVKLFRDKTVIARSFKEGAKIRFDYIVLCPLRISTARRKYLIKHWKPHRHFVDHTSLNESLSDMLLCAAPIENVWQYA